MGGPESAPDRERGYTAYNANGNQHRNIAIWLHDAGYTTALYGKFMNGDKGPDTPKPPGWDRWWVTDGPDFWVRERVGRRRNGKPRYRRRYTTDEIRDRAIGLLADADAPVFAYLGFPAPHDPAVPAPRHANVATASIDWDAPSRAGDLAGKPRHMQRPPITARERATIDQLEQNRLRSLAAVDEAIVAIVDAQRARNRPLVLVVASDQGYLMADHRWLGKTVPYDGVIRTPLFVSAPGLASGTDDRLVALQDIAPTIAALAGVTIPTPVDGRSLLNNWQRERLLIEWFGTDVPRAKEDALIRQVETPYKAIRTVDSLFARYQDDFTEFYDYRDDPDELVNLAVDGARSEAAAEAETWIEALRDCQAETCWRAES